MNSIYTFKIGSKDYNLRLTANAIKAIENKLGKSIFQAFENLKDNLVDTFIAVIWGSMQPLNPDFTYEQATDLFDDYIAEGHSFDDLMREVNGLLAVSGFFKKGQV